ncbi:MAG: DNA integrity scanning diadenylate cyclase DisA [Clostridiales bacterium]|jgi:diadenylate cyclase|nr:DNA integrity scanning diadenylate cyclase DisA [Eubacteriales bacterium]MDH7566270.1 DNA integrity scanning diadenylate cyclase DisA [Clostridiales bacterium]
MKSDVLKDDEILDLLRLVAPGTPLREGLDNILRAKTGALIVIGDSQEVTNLMDGGFFINKEYSPAHLYELAKMDGAIILSKDQKKILYANTLLMPDPSIPTGETGTRHKSAERVAKQTGEMVVCISQRRNIITLYKGSRKYILKDTSTILTRANQALQTLEKYRSVLDEALNNLGMLEFEDNVNLDGVAYSLQRVEMVMRIVAEIERYICELGNEGRLVSMQLEELLGNVEEEGLFIIEDYMLPAENRTAEDVLRSIRSLTYDELMDISSICRALGYSGGIDSSDIHISPRGYRIMSKVPRLPMSVVRHLVNKFDNFQSILKASIEELDEVEGIGEVRARTIKEGIRRVQDQLLMDSRYNVRI